MRRYATLISGVFLLLGAFLFSGCEQFITPTEGECKAAIAASLKTEKPGEAQCAFAIKYATVGAAMSGEKVREGGAGSNAGIWDRVKAAAANVKDTAEAVADRATGKMGKQAKACSQDWSKFLGEWRKDKPNAAEERGILEDAMRWAIATRVEKDERLAKRVAQCQTDWSLDQTRCVAAAADLQAAEACVAD